MAKAGLLYTGQEEQVKCTFCGCLLSDWQYGDQVSLGYYTPTVGGGYSGYFRGQGGDRLLSQFSFKINMPCFYDENGQFKYILKFFHLQTLH